MSIRTRIAAVTLLALACSGTVLADAQSGQKYFSPMIDYTAADSDRNADDDLNGFQLGFGFATDNWNTEFVYHSAELDLGLGNELDLRSLGVDFQRVWQRREPFSPYLYLGAGVLEWDPGIADSETGLTYSGGAGFYLDLGSEEVALRVDWRHRFDQATPGDADDDIFSVGLQIPFGRTKPVPQVVTEPADSDGDGVTDDVDNCPGTPAGTRVDAYGCPLVIDSDGDGVADADDACPGTVRGAKVGPDGCELDGDNDGIVDRLDECPDTAAGVQVDVKGCEIKAEIRLPGVNFETNSDRLLPGAERVLDDAAATLVRNPSIHVEVAGHTDSDGAADYNEGLSERRARTVRDYLAGKGVAMERMSVRGYGESQPVADNSTAAGKAENRRVVLRITAR